MVTEIGTGTGTGTSTMIGDMTVHMNRDGNGEEGVGGVGEEGRREEVAL